MSLHDGEEGVRVVQLSCETDFVARTEEFTDSLKALMRALACYPGQVADNVDIEKFMEVKLVDEKKDRYNNKTIKEVLALLSSNTLENCDINNLLKRTVRPGMVIGTYLHGELEGRVGEPRVGTRAGVAVCESQSRNIAGVKKLANSVAMQVAAMKPMYVARENLPESVMESKGKDKGFLEEMVLMEQQYVDTDEKKTVKEAIIQKQYELKAEIKFKEIFYYDCKQ